jgi:hypothetical protein
VAAACSKTAYESRHVTWILDLQVIRPDRYVEQEGEVVVPIDGALFAEARVTASRRFLHAAVPDRKTDATVRM